MTRLERWFTFAIVALAFAIRAWDLGYKPPHFDEGVNGWFIDQMRTNGHYRYDPSNYHGPLHFYALFASQQLFGRSEWALRIPTVLISTASVLLLLAFRRFVPFAVAAMAATMLALSPAAIFYARYAIHESWLPFFILLACFGAAGWVQDGGRKRDVWAIGIGCAGAVLTKETYILHAIAAVLALAILRVIDPNAQSPPTSPDVHALFSNTSHAPDTSPAPKSREASIGDILHVSTVCVAVTVSFYSGFGFAWEGVRGLWETWVFMWKKGHASGEGTEDAHFKEVLYYAKLLGWYEWPALAGLLAAPFVALRRMPLLGVVTASIGALFVAVGALVARAIDPLASSAKPWPAAEFIPPFLQLDPPGWPPVGSIGIGLLITGLAMVFAMPAASRLLRWLAFFGLGSFAAYSLVSYKTPWCILAALPPFYFVIAGMLHRGAQVGAPLLAGLVFLMLCAQSLMDMVALNFGYPSARINPVNDARPRNGNPLYTYVQTTFDIRKLTRPLRALIASDPSQRALSGLIIGERFPLVWLLGDLPNLRFAEMDNLPVGLDADFLLVPNAALETVEPGLLGTYYRLPYLTRSSGEACTLFLSTERFHAFFPTREPDFFPRPIPQEASR